jgi:hypothetical protein
VTTVAALRLYRHMLVDKRTFLVDMALNANLVPTRQCPYLTDRRGAMGVVTITALDETFVDPVVIWLCKVRFSGYMASVTESRLRLDQQVFRFLGVMRRVAV